MLEAHHEVSWRIRQKAPDNLTRDLGIVAAGQLAHHYWIASFGMLCTYASALGMSQAEQGMQASLDEARQFDQQQTADLRRRAPRRARRRQGEVLAREAGCRP